MNTPKLCPSPYPDLCAGLAEYPHESPYCLDCANAVWKQIVPETDLGDDDRGTTDSFDHH